MADFREIDASTDREPSGNERGSADHLLSTANLLAELGRPTRARRSQSLAERFANSLIIRGLEDWLESVPGEKVYFIGTDAGHVKIGRSTDVQGRLASMQTGSPMPLKILAVVDGGRWLEREYHAYFKDHRLHGEWFTICEAMVDEIRRHAW
jgi:hypothetical protein